MGRVRTALSVLVLLVLGFGCSSTPSTEPDAGPRPDAQAGQTEETAPDAGSTPADAGRAPADAATDAGAPTDPAQLAAQLAEAECGYVARCRELELAALGGPGACLAEGLARWRGALLARTDPPRLAEDAQACLHALANAHCWQAPRAYGRACWPAASGGRRLGEGCASSSDCAQGFCDSDAPGLSCGTCAAWRTIDQPCAADPAAACGPNGECVAGACLPIPTIALGCDGRCTEYLDCIFDQEGTVCLTPIGLGDRCDNSPGLRHRCPEERSLACIERECVSATLAELGEACGPAAWCRTPEQVCGPGGLCIERPRAALGAPCRIDLDCEATAFCGEGGCEARRTSGAACEFDAQCAAPLACLGAPRTCQARPDLVCP